MLDKGRMQAVQWRDVREDVAQHNARLCQLIDQLDPDDEYLLYKVSYPYGELIFERGKIKVPLESGEFVALSDPRLDKTIADDLSYSPVPIGYIAHNACEVYLEPIDRIVPLTYFTPGALMGLWETLDPPSLQVVGQSWNVSAGVRSTFMLPKITDVASHNRLRRTFKIASYTPQSLAEHWQLFKEISQHESFPVDWSMSIIYFSRKWIEKRQKDPAWYELYLYCYETAWVQSVKWRNKMYFERVWEMFAIEVFDKNLKPNLYIMNTAKHLVYIASGTMPGFKVATDDISGPFSALSQIYTDIYGLKQYLPTIMQPAHLDSEQDKQIVYYSLQLPTLLEYSKMMHKPSSAIADLREIKAVMDTLQNDFHVDERLFRDLIQRMQCHYFHNEPDSYGQIELTKKIPEYDTAISQMKPTTKKQVFADTGSFLRGCVSISLEAEQ